MWTTESEHQGQIEISDPDQNLGFTCIFFSLGMQKSVFLVNYVSLETDLDPSIELTFESKGLHFFNLNIQYIVPKIDELRITMAHEHSPDIFGMCETFFTSSVSDDLMTVDGFDLMRKDRSDTQNKAGEGVHKF